VKKNELLEIRNVGEIRNPYTIRKDEEGRQMRGAGMDWIVQGQKSVSKSRAKYQ